MGVESGRVGQRLGAKLAVQRVALIVELVQLGAQVLPSDVKSQALVIRLGQLANVALVLGLAFRRLVVVQTRGISFLGAARMGLDVGFEKTQLRK